MWDAVVSTPPPEQMTPEQIAEETAKAEQIVSFSEAVAQAGEVLPFPLDFVLMGGGALGVYLGRRKLAKLSKTAVSAAIAPAAKIVGKFVKKKIEASAPAEESPAQPEASATEVTDGSQKEAQ